MTTGERKKKKKGEKEKEKRHTKFMKSTNLEFLYRFPPHVSPGVPVVVVKLNSPAGRQVTNNGGY